MASIQSSEQYITDESDHIPSLGGQRRNILSGDEPKLTGEPAFRHILESLQHPDWQVRQRAAQMLAEHSEDGLAVLIEASTSSDWRTRRSAVRILGRVQDIAVIRPLLVALSDAHERVRADALAACEIAITNLSTNILSDVDLPTEITQAFLRGAAYQERGLRRIFLKLLGTVDFVNPEVLLDALNNGDQRSSYAAIRALSKRYLEPQELILTTRGARRLIEFYLNDTTRRRYEADQVMKMAAKSAVPSLLEIIHAPQENNEIRRIAVRALCAYGDERGNEVFFNTLRHDDPRMRRSALDAIGRVKAYQAVDLVAELLNSDPDVWVRNSAAWAFNQMPNPQVRVHLLNALFRENDETVQGNIVSALQHYEDEAVIQALLKVLKQIPQRPREYHHQSAINSLTSIGLRSKSEEHLHIILNALSDALRKAKPDTARHHQLISSLGQLGTEHFGRNKWLTNQIVATLCPLAKTQLP